MKSTKYLLTLIFAVLLILPVNAQMKDHHPDTTSSSQMNEGGMMKNMMGKGMMQNMMQGGMMGNMMPCEMCTMKQNMPMQKYMKLIQKLPMMTQQLSLTDSQSEELAKMKTGFMKKKIDYQADIDKKKIDLENLLDNNASSNEIRNAMLNIASTKIDMNISAYETANKMKNVLNDQQKQTLKNMQMNQGMMGGGMMKNMMQNGMMDGNGMMNGGVMNNENDN